jgi:hypothetical protein
MAGKWTMPRQSLERETELFLWPKQRDPHVAKGNCRQFDYKC